MTAATKRREEETKRQVERAIGRSGIDWTSVWFSGALVVLLLTTLSILLVLIADILMKAWPTFQERGITFVTDGLSLNPATAGVFTAIVGSVMIATIVAVISFPIGIAAAVWLEEYAPNNRFTQFVDTTVRNLAGVPSIVYGLLGLAIFVPLVRALGLGGSSDGKNVLAAGITMAVLVLPIVVITAAEAVRAVPYSIREAGFGVGATQWEVIRSHVVPSALPGILTGTVLTLARAIGETAPLLVIGVATGYFAPAGDATLADQITGPYTALPVVVFSWSRQTQAEFANTLAPAAIIVLLAVLFILNGAAIWLRNRTEKKW
ncbi:MAG: phosphate ABC transporter permease PstA [Actinomycetota bacterium]|jgi:phosphate transport system permease protein|nr:phosphate ABC transporter permease PstA [Actinomycetota bacterium]